MPAFWQPNRPYQVDITLPLDADMHAGVYQPDLALLDADGRRQNILAPDGHWIDDHLPLSRIRLQAAPSDSP